MFRQQVYAILAAILCIGLIVGWASAQTVGEDPHPETTTPSTSGRESAAEVPNQAGSSTDGSALDRDAAVAEDTSRQVLFQGVLSEDDQPVSGEKTIKYLFFDYLSLCNNIGAPGDAGASLTTQVNDGLFSVNLSETGATGGIFDGRKLYLSVEVEGYGLLADCEEILPTPYAVSLVPGAEIRNATSSAHLASSTIGVWGHSKAIGNKGAGVRGSSSNNGYGGLFGTGQYVALSVQNSSPASVGWPALEVINDAPDGDGHLITAWNGNDLEFKVHGNGDVTADGSFIGGGADYADLLSVAGNPSFYGPGDVLVIDVNGKMAKSTEPNSTRVAGIYSTNPAFIGDTYGATDSAPAGQTVEVDSSSRTEPVEQVNNEADSAAEAALPLETESDISLQPENRIPVALVGVVPVKVSAENGPIQPGDLLTTSSTPGHAMKASPVTVNGVDIYPTGVILGKAMGSLSADFGVIDVLVTLR
ncbi:MAG: hypothetical protein H6642_01760 [Caldilineaceae bacterium]|nr:hypothetical protein [Caldilineaceae bacterium]